MSGFIRLSRNFFEDAAWKQQRTFSLAEAWLDLIQSARFEAEPATVILPNGRELTIRRGQLRASLRFLAKRWGWGVEKTKRFIDRHIEKHHLERTTEQGETVLTLCNYEKYNPPPNTGRYTGPVGGRTPGSTPDGTNYKNGKKGEEHEETEERGRTAQRFTAPSQDDIAVFISENGYSVSPEAFFNFYQAKGWMVGSNRMKDWRAAVRVWQSKEKSSAKKESYGNRPISRTAVPAEWNWDDTI